MYVQTPYSPLMNNAMHGTTVEGLYEAIGMRGGLTQRMHLETLVSHLQASIGFDAEPASEGDRDTVPSPSAATVRVMQ
jgi:hypothetical protein